MHSFKKELIGFFILTHQWKQFLQIPIAEPLCRVFRALLKGTFIQLGIQPALPAACQSKNQGVLELICQWVISPSILASVPKI